MFLYTSFHICERSADQLAQLVEHRITVTAGLQIISRLVPVKLSHQTYFCSDISHSWPDKHR